MASQPSHSGDLTRRRPATKGNINNPVKSAGRSSRLPSNLCALHASPIHGQPTTQILTITTVKITRPAGAW
jgi:hypothetical protein